MWSRCGCLFNLLLVQILEKYDGKSLATVDASPQLFECHSFWVAHTRRSNGWEGATIAPATPGLPLVWGDQICAAKWRIDLRSFGAAGWATACEQTVHSGFAVTLTDGPEVPFCGNLSELIKNEELTFKDVIAEFETRHKTDKRTVTKLWAHLVLFSSKVSTMPIQLAVCEVDVVPSMDELRAAYTRLNMPVVRSGSFCGLPFSSPFVSLTLTISRRHCVKSRRSILAACLRIQTCIISAWANK